MSVTTRKTIRTAVELLRKAVEEADRVEVLAVTDRVHLNVAVTWIEAAISELQSHGAEFPEDADGNRFQEAV